MSCGNNPLLDAAKGLKDSMKGLMEAGEGALGDLQSKLSELESKIGEFVPELPDNPKLQDLVDALRNSTTAEEFAENYREINEKFGEAWDDMNEKLEEMGLGSFPPTLDATQNYIKNETGIDMAALLRGDFSTIQAKIDEATEAGETPPNISQILAGDFSSLGIEGLSSADDIPSIADQICDQIPKLEETTIQVTDPETGEVRTETRAIEFPTPSQISTSIPDFSGGSLSSMMNEYMEQVKVFREGERLAYEDLDEYMNTIVVNYPGYSSESDEDAVDFFKMEIEAGFTAYYRVKLADTVKNFRGSNYPELDNITTDGNELYYWFLDKTRMSQVISGAKLDQVADWFTEQGVDEYRLHQQIMDYFYANALPDGVLFGEFYINLFNTRFKDNEVETNFVRAVRSDGSLATFNVNRELPPTTWKYQGRTYTLYGEPAALAAFERSDNSRGWERA